MDFQSNLSMMESIDFEEKVDIDDLVLPSKPSKILDVKEEPFEENRCPNLEGSEKKLLEISQIFFSLQSPVDTESPPLKTETPDIEVKDEIEEKLEAMEKGIEEPSEKVEVGEDEGKVKEDFNAADAALSASEYTADEKVRVEYIPQGKQMSNVPGVPISFGWNPFYNDSFKNSRN